MKKVIKVMFFSLLSFQLIIGNSQAGKIYDYTYEGENDIIVANRSAGKKIALTFDDGPCILYTGEILKILKENNATATFFVIGANAQQYPELVKQAFNEGHEIGNHTYSHPNLRGINKDKLNLEISKTNKIIQEITGRSPILFRPPGGYLSNLIVDCISENNCRPVLWSWRQDTEDWKKPPANIIIEKIIKNIQDGDIILFHDFNTEGSTTPDALRMLLPKLRNLGYSFVTVSELVNMA